MLAKFARSLTPRVISVIVLVAAAVAAALVATLGSHSPSSAASAPQRLGAAGAAGTASSSATASGAAVGSGPIVNQAVHHDLSPPLRTLKPVVVPSSGPQYTPDAGENHVFDTGGGADTVVQGKPGARQIPSLGVNFEGIGVGQGGSPSYSPPDENGAVGPSNYFEIVNSAIGIFTKTGTLIYGPAATNTLWSGFGGQCQTQDNGDGTVSYDQFANRWIVTQFAVSSAPYLECVAISQTSDPTGAYYRYAFSYGSNFNDYPKLGVWPDAYYVTYNIFANGVSYTGPQVCALDKASMLAGQAATEQCFKLSGTVGTLLPSTVDGTTAPPAGTPNFVLSMATNSLQLWKFHVDWATPANSTLSGPQQFSVASFIRACNGGACIPQPNSSVKLDSLGDRLMYRLAYRNFGDHESLVVAHSVSLTGTVGMRWYEIRSPNTAPTVYQQSTYSPDTTYRWMGSAAMDHVGDIALGYAVSSITVRPGVRYTGRLVGDPLSTMGQEGTIVSGTGSQIDGLNRWGDYTSMSIDPTDDCTFWYVGEYLTSDGSWNWHTRIGSFKFPSCTSGGGGNPPVVTSFTPTSGPVGTSVDITGTAFTGATSVTFGGVGASTFNVDSATEIHATVPGGAQTGPIAVTTPNGTGASVAGFTVTGGGGGSPPTVTSFTPTSGAVGTSVSITGTGFTGVTSVTFNGTASTNVTFNSDTSLTARVPTGATTGPIAVTTPNGTGTSATSFAVTTAPPGKPSISSFTPTSGRRGIQVTINGNNFNGATSVRLGLVSAAFTVSSNTQIKATVPPGARVGFQYHWSVTGPGGTGTSIGYFRVTG